MRLDLIADGVRAAHDTATVAVFLNYRTSLDTIRAVRSLQNSESSVSKIIIVDNASGDGSVAILTCELPETLVLAAETNGGFSAGCNLGIAEALRLGATRILLLNSDILMCPDALGALQRALDADTTLGIVGPALVSLTHPEVVESLGIRYSSRTGRMRHNGFRRRLSTIRPFECRYVDGVSGCAMLIRRDVLEEVGPLAEEYFFGFEDLDLCLRARHAGFRTGCIGTAVVRHEGHASIGRRSGKRIYFATRNHLLLAHRHSKNRSLTIRWLRALAILGFNIGHVLYSSDVPRTTGLRACAAGMRDYVSGRSGPGSFSDRTI